MVEVKIQHVKTHVYVVSHTIAVCQVIDLRYLSDQVGPDTTGRLSSTTKH